MPYISDDARDAIEQGMNPHTLGELNYVITKAVLGYWHNHSDLSYSGIASITGVLENVKQEFYRRVAVPYEEQKIKENGDVY